MEETRNFVRCVFWSNWPFELWVNLSNGNMLGSRSFSFLLNCFSILFSSSLFIFSLGVTDWAVSDYSFHSPLAHHPPTVYPPRPALHSWPVYQFAFVVHSRTTLSLVLEEDFRDSVLSLSVCCHSDHAREIK